MLRPALLGLLLLACARAATTYTPSTAEPPPVARELRGAWVAAVNNIDWPSKKTLTTAQQQSELRAILDKCAALKLNVVILQVRPACDALYASKLEPWSEYLTGTQGQAPKPFWDPLEFAVREAHQRGLELHAWFNPFRARHSTGNKTVYATNHVSRTRPDLVKTYGSHLWLDPGLQEVHDWSARVILDVVQRYDLDGIHIDDYFYPYVETNLLGKIAFPDDASFSAYQKSGGKLDRGDWRRDNVNRFIARMYRDVKAVKPWVEVGISPFGIYRPGFPAQIQGFDQYASIYADPRAWLANGWLDYLVPQLYWRIDPPKTSFPVLLKWWTENNPKQKQIVAGINTTAIGAATNYTVTDAGNKGWPAGEIVRQIQLTRQQSGIAGHVHWNMGALMKNKGGVSTHLALEEYKLPALAPSVRGSGSTTSAPPALTAVSRGEAVRFLWSATTGQAARFWILQVRRGAAWQTEILPGNHYSREYSTPPDAVSIRAVDKFGQTGRARVLKR